MRAGTARRYGVRAGEELVIVSTGHRIDAPGRARPRFPSDRENAARAAIRKAVAAEKLGATGAVRGISGLASGNDILFHEVCAELGIPTVAVLALPEPEYVERSVVDAGGDWVDRFHDLYARLETEVLGEFSQPPVPVEDQGDGGVFSRANIWLLEKAFAVPDARVTLIALWNGEGGDGPGGTEDMVRRAGSRGANVVVIDSNELFGLGE